MVLWRFLVIALSEHLYRGIIEFYGGEQSRFPSEEGFMQLGGQCATGDR